MDASDEIHRLRSRLRELEARAAVTDLICDQIPVVVWITDKDLRFTWACGTAVDGFESIGPEIAGTTLYEYFGTTDPTFPPIESATRALSGDTVRYMNDWLGRRFLVTMAPLRSEAGEIVGTLGVALDSSAQKRAEDALLTNETRYRALFDHATDVVCTLTLDGRFTDINPAGERLLGYDRASLLALTVEDIVEPEHRELPTHVLRLHLRGEGPPNFELHVRGKSGERILLDVSISVIYDADGVPLAVQALARDVTVRRKLDEQVRQTQKLEAIGVLSGGIAHDFNNLLTGILGNAYLLRSKLRDRGAGSEALSGIIESADRAQQLTQQLLGFVRQGQKQALRIDVHALIRSVASFLARTIDKRIEIHMEFDAPGAEILGDANQVYQVLLNLGLNARDAMPDGGRLAFATKLAGDSVRITVRDSGSGIPDGVRDRMFEPFFTTKPPDKGTGLGLAMVYSIVQAHGGSIDVESGPGRTAFHVHLPLAEPSHAPARPGNKPFAPQRSRGRILVIDDEAVVRRVLSQMLKELGYEVTGASDSVAAIEFYGSHADSIDLVILDLVMPKLGGKACLERLRAVNPNVRAVLSSGYGPDGAVEEVIRTGLVAFLQKPYTLEKLATVVREALDMKAAQPA